MIIVASYDFSGIVAIYGGDCTHLFYVVMVVYGNENAYICLWSLWL